MSVMANAVRGARPHRWLIVGLIALSACGWPGLSGHETFAELQAAHDGRGPKGHVAGGDCWLDRDSNACAWLSAYWRADYASSAKRCEAGGTPLKEDKSETPCQHAAAYALGCGTVRGHPSGSSDEPHDFNDANQGKGPHCSSSEPYPQNMINPPPIDVPKALELIATGCRVGVRDDCGMMVEILTAGLVSGFVIPQDMNLAHEFFLRDQELHSPGQAAEDLQETWTGIYAKDALTETPEARAERIRMVVAFYARGPAFNASLATEIAANAETYSALNGIAAGLSAGLATNAAVNQNLATAQTNINTTVAASNALHANKSSPQATLGAKTTPTQAGQAQSQATEAQRKSHLASCLAARTDCGRAAATTPACRPVTHTRPAARTYAFIAWRQLLEVLRKRLDTCLGSKPWPDCEKESFVSPSGKVGHDDSDLRQYGDAVSALGGRYSNLADAPTRCPLRGPGQLDGTPIKMLDEWCWASKEACLPALDSSIANLEAAQSVAMCVDDLTGEVQDQQQDAQQKVVCDTWKQQCDAGDQQHDVDCHAKFGY